MQKVKMKVNILSELYKLNMALKPYKKLLANVRDSDSQEEIILFWHNNAQKMKFASSKSKFFYKCLIKDKVTKPVSQNKWLCSLNLNSVDFETVYTKKIVFVKDRKIAEFNFKVLQYIIPCNVNLYNWKVKMTKKCKFCNVDEDILHLLFYCVYADKVWKHVEKSLHRSISVNDVILGTGLDNELIFTISLISYFIYKRWLAESFNNEVRILNNCIEVLRYFIKYKRNVYANTKEIQYSMLELI
ncbi:MAG: hypothetical protein GY702_00135 [Desulfobulbaceae bacterium]|nr:hypothetical protein [Desulfobulbaceae bacterium]